MTTTQRLIRSDFRDRKGATLKINHATHPQTAVLNAIMHLQMEHYTGACIVDIYDESTAELHAVITVGRANTIQIAFSRDPKTPVCITLP